MRSKANALLATLLVTGVLVTGAGTAFAAGDELVEAEHGVSTEVDDKAFNLAELSSDGETAAHLTESTFVFEGGGWGHGVGMSQYGAFGQALEGSGYAGILRHYYSGATIDTLAAMLPSGHYLFKPEAALWIGLLQNRTSFTFEAIGGPLELCLSGDGTGDCPKPDAIPQPGEVWKLEQAGGGCRFVRVAPPMAAGEEPSGSNQPCRASISWGGAGLASRLDVEGREYAHGTLRIRKPSTTSGFHVSLEIGLQDYLYGIAEMPNSWRAEALKAQVVAARTYAVYRALTIELDPTRSGTDPAFDTNRQQSCWCHLYSTVRDQNYLGWGQESAAYATSWKAAVDETRGKVLVHPQIDSSLTEDLIQAFYSSSTGGATEDNEDVWGGSPLPYLRSRDDHWAIEDRVGNPFRSWGQPEDAEQPAVTASTAAGSLGWDQVTSVDLIGGPPGSVVEFRGRDNGAAVATTRTGYSVRGMFGLRSPYISGVRSVGPPPPGSDDDPPAPSKSTFTDIDGSVHRDDIVYIAELGITKGCNPPDNTRYCPGDWITRGQMAAFLVRAFGLPASGVDAFDDDDGTTFENDINALAAAGITSGCGTRRYCPSDRMTRDQMAAFMVNAFDLQGSGEDHFVDDAGLTLEPQINALFEAGITKGCNPPANDRYCPRDPVTRAQMASFLTRALKAFGT